MWGIVQVMATDVHTSPAVASTPFPLSLLLWPHTRAPGPPGRAVADTISASVLPVPVAGHLPLAVCGLRLWREHWQGGRPKTNALL
jgi:hypothetical protein